MSVWLTLETVPTGMPIGKIEVRFPCFQPAVTSRSPGLTTADFGTWSTMIALPGSLWRSMPAAPVFGSTTETKLDSSVISFTCDAAREDARHDSDEEAGRRDDGRVGGDAVAAADARPRPAGRTGPAPARGCWSAGPDSPAESSARRCSAASPAGRCSPGARSGARRAVPRASRSRPCSLRLSERELDRPPIHPAASRNGCATRLAATSNGLRTVEPALCMECRPPFDDSRK